MADIIKEIIKVLPEGKIHDSCYEGANIVLYTKHKDYFLDNKGTIMGAVNEFKKRIELRPDPAITLPEEQTEKLIKKLIPKEAGNIKVIFDPQRSHVFIEAEKPGAAIGKSGSILNEIKEKTLWIPVVQRLPAMNCEVIDGIKHVLYENNDYRRKFLDKTGQRVYNGWTRSRKNQWVRLTYLGAARQVGRSCILLQTQESRILMDCGIDVAGTEADQYPFFDAPEFRIDELDAVIVSHAHLDHSGLIPLLLKYGYKGPIYCTAPTRDIMALLQLDLVKIMRSEGKEPLYTAEDVKEMVKNTITLNYEEVTDITPDIRITFYNAGHILGSALTHLHIGNGLHNLIYSGDMKFMDSHLLEKAATKFPRLETLMIESTYGGQGNIAAPREQSEKEFTDIVIDTVKKGGKVMVPVLGTGRAQEIQLVVEELIRKKHIPEIPVYVDGAVWEISAIHTAYPEFMHSDLQKMIVHKDQNPFLNPCFRQVGSHKERRAIIEEGGPCIVLGTSGMMTGGPIVEYFKHWCESEKNAIIFVSYLGEGSLGRRIANGEKEIAFITEGNKTQIHHVRLGIHQLDGFTGHAGRNELMDYIGKCQPRPRKVLINHGEARRCIDLASSLHKKYRVETAAPRNLETVRLR